MGRRIWHVARTLSEPVEVQHPASIKRVPSPRSSSVCPLLQTFTIAAYRRIRSPTHPRVFLIQCPGNAATQRDQGACALPETVQGYIAPEVKVAPENVAWTTETGYQTWKASKQVNTEQDFKPLSQDFWLDIILNPVWVYNARVCWLPGMPITHTMPDANPNWPTREEFEECAAMTRDFWVAPHTEDDSANFANNLLESPGVNTASLTSFSAYHETHGVQDKERLQNYEPVREDVRSSMRPAIPVNDIALNYATPRRWACPS
ncbi:hypothetical protein B0H21DRAFT_549753 [Amylocystis lapponica]|nr:hypothetical protein B0H21DRAFT_549753 [Amylocystis lapponica]